MSESNGKLLNNSGIHSLAGFAFQIKVFAYYALCISKENERVEFETLDDITTNVSNKNIDSKVDSFRCIATYSDRKKLIQVKRSNLNLADFDRTLYNWILQTNESLFVDKYILFSAKENNNEDLMFKNGVKELFEKAINTNNKKSTAIEVQIKSIYINNFDKFEKIYNSIKSKYVFIGDKDIDDLIFETAKLNLRYNDKNKSLYKERLEFFMNTIQNKVLYSINKKEPLILDFQGILKIYEDMNTSLNENTYWPPYYSYKEKLDYISLEDSMVSNLRETKQLLFCELNPANTIERLKQLIYYQHFRTLSAENGQESKPKKIETTTYNNFQSVIEELADNQNDKPKIRLLKTEKRSNMNAPNDEIRCGSCIYLTGDNVINQISWKDD